MEVYQQNPIAIKRLSPDLFSLLEKRVKENYSKRKMKPAPFGLTERERGERLRAIERIVQKRPLKELSQEEARQVLEHVAALSTNRGLPNGFRYREISVLLSKVIGRPLSKIKARQTFNIAEGSGFREVVVLRGVRLRLTNDFKLTSVDVNPKGLEERRRALTIVGIGRDERNDVVEHHDRYLAMEDQNGSVYPRVVVDTSAFYAICSATNKFHLDAREAFETLLDKESELWVTSYSVVETITLLHRKLGREAAKTWWESVRDIVQVCWFGPNMHKTAWKRFVDLGDADFSFVDITNLVLAETLNRAPIFTINKAFSKVIPVIPSSVTGP